MCKFMVFALLLLAGMTLSGGAQSASLAGNHERTPIHTNGGNQRVPGNSPAVTLAEDDTTFTLANGLVTARIQKQSGTLISLQYQGLELVAPNGRGSTGGYWSYAGGGRLGTRSSPSVRLNPASNGGERAEISCRLYTDPQVPTAQPVRSAERGAGNAERGGAGVEVDYRYALGRGETWLYVSAVLEHKPGYPVFGVGEARYCVKLNPEVFDFLTVDAERQRLMPSGADWDQGAPLNLKEARRMTTGVHKGEAEHKYDYAAVLAETPAYGWSSTTHRVGLWLINPSQEYIGGGPTKAELTGHLDVNPGGTPTLLNMWVGSHYGGTSLRVGQAESWTKFVGPFLLYCNAATNHEALLPDALARAAEEKRQWPYAWVADPGYPPGARRGVVQGQLVLEDVDAARSVERGAWSEERGVTTGEVGAPDARMSNIWVGVTAPDYALPSRFGPQVSVDWQRDAKFYQFWVRADAQGRFSIPQVRPGTYTLHAIADGVLGEFTRTNLSVSAGQCLTLGRLAWKPTRFGRTLWQIGVPDRTAREFRHGDHYWQWGLYFDYPREFPNDVNFVIGQSDWRRDWNYVQPPRIQRDVERGAGSVERGARGEEESEETLTHEVALGGKEVRSTTWSITFVGEGRGRGGEGRGGRGTLRLAFCGTHVGCNVEAFVNGKSIGETGPLPSTSAMQRDGIRAYWVEKDLGFDAALLTRGTNVIQLLSHARSWSQGVMYDCVRLEVSDN